MFVISCCFWLACLTSNNLLCLHTHFTSNRFTYQYHTRPPSCLFFCAQRLSAQPGSVSDSLCRVPKGLHKRLVSCNMACSNVYNELLHQMLHLISPGRHLCSRKHECTRHECTIWFTCKEGLQEGAVLVLPFEQLLRLCQVICNLRPSGHADWW